MTVQRYRRKPRRGDEDVLSAALYLPGELTGLRTVAYLADPGAELATVHLVSGLVLLVRWLDGDDGKVQHTIVRAGRYLAHSCGGLFETDVADLRHWYDEVSDS